MAETLKMSPLDAIVALAKIAIDQRSQLASLSAQLVAQGGTVAELSARVQAAEKAAAAADVVIEVPADFLGGAVPTLTEPVAEGEAGTVAMPEVV